MDSQPTLFVKTSKNRQILFISMADCQLFDQIQDKKKEGIDLHQAIEHFKDYRLSDAYCKIIYKHENVHWDMVFYYNREIKIHCKLRRAYEFSLLKAGLVIERETSTEDDSIAFLKVLVPYETLLEEAELINLKMPLKVFYMPCHVNRESDLKN
jgi:hypothetical protein